MKRKNTTGPMELKLTVWTSSYLSDTQPPSDSCHAYCNVFTGRKCVTFECGSLENGNHSQRATIGGVPILRAFNIHHTRWIKKVCFGCCEGEYLLQDVSQNYSSDFASPICFTSPMHYKTNIPK